MSQAIRPRVEKEFKGGSKCCVSLVIVCQFVCIGDCMIACVLYCCSYKDHSRSALLLISGPGWWANVEGTSGVPGHQAQSGKGVRG